MATYHNFLTGPIIESEWFESIPQQRLLYCDINNVRTYVPRLRLFSTRRYLIHRAIELNADNCNSLFRYTYNQKTGRTFVKVEINR